MTPAKKKRRSALTSTAQCLTDTPFMKKLKAKGDKTKQKKGDKKKPATPKGCGTHTATKKNKIPAPRKKPATLKIQQQLQRSEIQHLKRNLLHKEYPSLKVAAVMKTVSVHTVVYCIRVRKLRIYGSSATIAKNGCIHTVSI